MGLKVKEIALSDAATMDSVTRAHEEDVREARRLILRLLLADAEHFSLADLARLTEALGRLSA